MKKILVIDDKKDNLTTISAVVAGNISDCKILTALSGEEGIKLAREEQPDTILLDIIMPKMDGYEVCKKLKAHNKTKHIPIIMITAIDTDKESRIKGLDIGADAFLSKPIDPSELIAQLNVMLRIKGAEDKIRLEKENLEGVVKDRTSDLLKKNIDLQSEINKREISENALKSIATEFARVSGLEYFEKVCKHLINTLYVDYAFIGKLSADKNSVIVQKGYEKEELLKPFEYDLAGTPCENVIGYEICAYPSNVQSLFPKDHLLVEMGIEGYLGIPLFDRNGVASGIIVLLTEKPLSNPGIASSVLQIFADRVATEMERMQAKTDLAASNEQLDLALYGSNAGLWSWNIKTGEDVLDERWCGILGYRKDDLEQVVSTWERLIHPDDKDRIFDAVQKHFEDEKNEYNHEYRMKCKNGDWKWIHALGKVVERDSDGNPYRMTGIIIDINERKLAEEELIFKEREYRTLTENMPGVVFRVFCKEDNKMGFYNDLLPEVTGYKLEELMRGDTCSIFPYIHPEDQDYVIKNVDQAVREKTQFNLEYRFKHKNGETRYFNEIGKPIFDSDDTLLYLEGMIFDITDRKKANIIFEQNQFYLKKAQEIGKIGQFSYDPIKNIVDGSDVLFRLFDVERDQNLFEAFATAVHPEDEHLIFPLIERAIKEGIPYDIIHRIKQKDGTILFVNAKGEMIDSHMGQRLFGTVQDITKSLMAEEDLLKTKNSLQKAQDIAKTGSWELDALTKKLVWSNQLFQILEISTDQEPTFDLYYSRVHPDDLSYVKQIGAKVYDNNEAHHASYRILTPSGTIKYITTEGQQVVNRDGTVLKLYGIVQDVTERKMAEQALRESEEQFRSIFENKGTATGLFGDDSIIQDCNSKFIELSGYSKTEIIDKMKWSDFVVEEDLERMQEFHAQRVKSGTPPPSQYECSIINNSGEIKRVIANIALSGTNRIVSLTDITDRKKAEEALYEAKEKAEESDRLKSAFLANMSHEIRTPMNSILGFMDLLKEPDLADAEKNKFIGIVNDSGERLLNTINDIIEISKIESGDTQIVNQDIDIQELLAYYEKFFLPAISSKGLHFHLIQGSNLKNVILYSDKNKLDSIITNLINNAIKFTATGSIEVGCEVNKDELLFFVKDTGIGIEKERMKAVFDRFVHADQDRTKGYEGSGLGLPISKSYVKMLGGRIWCGSKVNQGTTFYFTIPLGKGKKNVSEDNISKEKKRTKVLPKPINKLKIVIVEDHEPSLLLLTNLLQRIDCDITHFYTGAEAIKLCQSNPDIDIILMDIKLPDINGYEATKKIRESNKEVYIIAQTAFALAGDKEKAIQAGCNEYISKPIKREKLFEIIEKYFGK